MPYTHTLWCTLGKNGVLLANFDPARPGQEVLFRIRLALLVVVVAVAAAVVSVFFSALPSHCHWLLPLVLALRRRKEQENIKKWTVARSLESRYLKIKLFTCHFSVGHMFFFLHCTGFLRWAVLYFHRKPLGEQNFIRAHPEAVRSTHWGRRVKLIQSWDDLFAIDLTSTHTRYTLHSDYLIVFHTTFVFF